jgi:pyridoxal phosphate enzyme (YggS family)
MSIAENLENIKRDLGEGVTLVAVSKYSTEAEIMEAYEAGHRDFGENKAQELQTKHENLPDDIRWHFIGHLQRNKVKYIIDYVHTIHSVDSMRLLAEINKRAKKAERIVPCLLQMHIAQEQTKFGLDRDELDEILKSDRFSEFENVKITGLMGMATDTGDTDEVKNEFEGLSQVYYGLKENKTRANLDVKHLSMGMSKDYEIALPLGSDMVRIGSAVFKS